MMALDSIDVRLVSGSWDFASAHAREIDVYWTKRTAEQRGLFNGSVVMLKHWAVEERRFSGECFETDFKSFLYWREHGAPDPHVYDFFGVGPIHSAEGWLLLGRAGPAMSNAGAVYPPSGSIDLSEAERGAVDVDASIIREILEETGLELTRSQLGQPFLITAPPQIAIIRPISLHLSAARLVRHIAAHLERKQAAEICELILVRCLEDIDRNRMPPFVQQYITAVFAGV